MPSEVIEDCKKNGKLDPSKIGATSNVGLMAAKAPWLRSFRRLSAFSFGIEGFWTWSLEIQQHGAIAAWDSSHIRGTVSFVPCTVS